MLGTRIASFSLHSPLSDDFSVLQITTGGSLYQIKSLTENVFTEVTNILLTPYSFVPNWEFSPAAQIQHTIQDFSVSGYLSQHGRIFSLAAAAVQIIYLTNVQYLLCTGYYVNATNY